MEVATIDGKLVATRLRKATRPRDRAAGLLRESVLAPGEALLISPARQVHTFGMNFAIDVLFFDPQGCVLHEVRAMRPWRVTKWVRGAAYVVELPSGTLSGHTLRGSRLELSSVDESSR